MVAVFWFLLIRPQRQRQAAHRNLMAQLAPGDEVVTAGGMIGTLRSIEGTTSPSRSPRARRSGSPRRRSPEFAGKTRNSPPRKSKGAANLVRHKWLLVAPICSYSGSRLPRSSASSRSRSRRRPSTSRPSSVSTSRAASRSSFARCRRRARAHRRRHGPLGRDRRSRVDKLGVGEPEIRQQGEDQISLQLPGISDPQAAADLVGKTAQLWLSTCRRTSSSRLRRARVRRRITRRRWTTCSSC